MLKVLDRQTVKYEHEGDKLSEIDARIIALSWAILNAHEERARLQREQEVGE